MTVELSFQQLHTDDNPHVIFRCIAGSRAYNLYQPDSDTDIRGIFRVPVERYLSLFPAQSQVADTNNDRVYYSLRRVMELAAQANPNILELLFMPDHLVLHRSPTMDRLQAQRHRFVTQKAYDSHIGYARTQIKKARGQNKWVNNPQPEQPPARADFCWYIPLPREEDPRPFRPVPLLRAGIDLTEYHCAALEHSRDTYRLYHYGSTAKGVFRGGNLVCESIPLEDESTRLAGLLLFNDQGWQAALRDHQHYWQWRKHRNDARWLDQESGEMDYDAKNLMHTCRLLMSGEHILREGAPRVWFEGEQRDFLLAVRQGHYRYDELMDWVDEALDRLETLRKAASLPTNPDEQAIDRLLLELNHD